MRFLHNKLISIYNFFGKSILPEKKFNNIYHRKQAAENTKKENGKEEGYDEQERDT